MSDCIPLAQVQNFASKDVNRIVGQIARVLARKSPFINSVDGGTLPNSSDVVRSVVEEMAVPNASLAAPTFLNDSDIAFGGFASTGNPNWAASPSSGTIKAPYAIGNGVITQDTAVAGKGPNSSGTPWGNFTGSIASNSDVVGTTEYVYQLQTLRGAGPRVNVKTARAAFKGSYLQAQVALEKTILQLINADIRWQFLVQSGVKYVCSSTQSFSSNLTGDMQQINTGFANVLPDSPMNFKTLYRIGTFLREEMLAEPFASKDGEFFQVLASADQIENFRNDADVKEDLLYLTAGSFKIGDDSITGYQFMGYRGFAFGIDQQPIRFITGSTGSNPAVGPALPVTSGSTTLYVAQPIKATAVTNGYGQRRNPDWVSAPYEVMFVIAGESFKRLVPEQYVGEGTFRFAPQLAMGELEWTYFRDNDCNLYGDFGQHIYQISRAFQPIRPQNVVAVLYKRCPFDGQALACSTSTTGL